MNVAIKPFSLLLFIFATLFPLISCAGFWSVKPTMADVVYGADPAQTMDVYLPPDVKQAPVIMMVHGGAWKTGDKGARSVVHNKVKRWVKKGFIFISINNRLMPNAKPLAQADDVRAALAFAQNHAKDWGGDPSQFILIGHSAGAHLVSLVSTMPALAASQGVSKWLGTIAIDSAAYDVDVVMRAEKPKRFYQQAFGDNPTYWKLSSPLYQMQKKTVPFLAVCSTQRKDGACEQAEQFVQKAMSVGSIATVLPVDLSHRKVNSQLGKDNAYTHAVERFMKKLSAKVAHLLA